MIVPNLHLLTLEAPDVARKMRPGQFVIVRPRDEGERIPLTVADWDPEKGTVTFVFMEVGASTGALALLGPGDVVPTCVGPLGNATEIADYGNVVSEDKGVRLDPQFQVIPLLLAGLSKARFKRDELAVPYLPGLDFSCHGVLLV